MNIFVKDYYVFGMKKIKKISSIVLISVLIVPQGLAGLLKSDFCIDWIRGNSDSNILCVMKEVPNEDSREKDSALWIKSPMECCGKMADTIPNWGILTNLKREPQPSSMQFSIHIVPDISECSRQTNLVYQESLVTISHPPLKIFKEVNSYII